MTRPQPRDEGRAVDERRLPARVEPAPNDKLAVADARFREDLEGAARYFEGSLAEATRRAYAAVQRHVGWPKMSGALAKI